MTKIVINKCYGGFGLSNEALVEYGNLKGYQVTFYKGMENFKKTTSDDDGFFVHTTKMDLGDTTTNEQLDQNYFSKCEIERDDTDLIKVVQLLGEKANGRYAQLKVVEIPDDVEWTIEEYDGIEWVAEKHRTWE